MRVGELFNPRNLFVGLWIPDALARSHDISHGAKMTYARLCWHTDPRTSECAPDTETLADGIGVSKRQIIIYLKELQQFGLIHTKRRGLGKTNSYGFPWHPLFDSNPLRRSATHSTSGNAEAQSIASLKAQRVTPQKVQVAAPPIEDLEEMLLEGIKTRGSCSRCGGCGEVITTKVIRGMAMNRSVPCPNCKTK